MLFIFLYAIHIDLSFYWYIYREPGTYKGDLDLKSADNPDMVSITVPSDIGTGTIHVILEVHDNGSPSLVSYPRAIITGIE
ncbi:hypothetical protein [Negadavirga shengliensis]|uniref:Cellulose-binding Sde182 C-terminal domain-containing protein n=1 Tax=Negadavirga shengliensis TaxID=1389218 RepID=A0ABV9T1Y6_9BACT